MLVWRTTTYKGNTYHKQQGKWPFLSVYLFCIFGYVSNYKCCTFDSASYVASKWKRWTMNESTFKSSKKPNQSTINLWSNPKRIASWACHVDQLCLEMSGKSWLSWGLENLYEYYYYCNALKCIESPLCHFVTSSIGLIEYKFDRATFTCSWSVVQLQINYRWKFILTGSY